MQNQVKRLQWAVILVALRVVGVVALCVAALSFLAFHSTPRAYAADASLHIVSGSISSFPTGGQAGTQITVAGSGWTGADGTPVTFGYEATVNSSCTIVTDARNQNGSLSNGSFSGWFYWPAGTALSTYPVCAVIGTTPATTMAVAGNFSVFSSTPPTVSIAPSTLSPNIQATVTASNYYPAGMQVNFLWMSGNTVVDTLNSATSDTNGIAVLNFTVPSLSIASGSYSINASVGSGQSAMLPSSTSFTYNAPIVPPSPTPRPSPSPSPKPSPAPSPAATPGVTPTATTAASATATTGTTPTASASPGASPTVASGQVPTTGGATPGNNDGSNPGAPTTSSSGKTALLGVGLAVLLLGLLLAGVAVVLLVRRKQKTASALAAQAIPPMMLNNPWQASWSNPQSVFTNNGTIPPPLHNNPAANADTAIFQPPVNNMPVMTNMPAPIPVGAGTSTGNGNWYPPITVPADPALDAMRRQAQAGLFAAPRPFQDERSQ